MLDWYGSDFDVEDAGIDRILYKFVSATLIPSCRF
jgi:hypothetical protein